MDVEKETERGKESKAKQIEQAKQTLYVLLCFVFCSHCLVAIGMSKSLLKIIQTFFLSKLFSFFITTMILINRNQNVECRDDKSSFNEP